VLRFSVLIPAQPTDSQRIQFSLAGCLLLCPLSPSLTRLTCLRPARLGSARPDTTLTTDCVAWYSYTCAYTPTPTTRLRLRSSLICLTPRAQDSDGHRLTLLWILFYL
jgi:hypothetical protein